jgi:hypothetical protein
MVEKRQGGQGGLLKTRGTLEDKGEVLNIYPQIYLDTLLEIYSSYLTGFGDEGARVPSTSKRRNG